ncbi:60S ribosomal protein L23a-like [Phyllostomus hastatus]|uniref:60S ribosomal protein L23a-like n=1 Tax=Phyllostomus hastatus TaxID=9423 RepID=UPI001E68287B|nr:60S ribosomal protein L23a-like [Phyllostomus hastatus]
MLPFKETRASLFHENSTKNEGNPPKAEGKAKALKAREAVLKGIHSHKKEDLHTHLLTLNTLWLQKQPKYSQTSAPRRNKLDHYTIVKFPLTMESATKRTEDNNPPVFMVEVKAKEHQIKQAGKKLCHTDVAKSTP